MWSRLVAENVQHGWNRARKACLDLSFHTQTGSDELVISAGSRYETDVAGSAPPSALLSTHPLALAATPSAIVSTPALRS
jgi:hypothetical protein